MIPLQNRLILSHFMCAEFGYADIAEMLERLSDVPTTITGIGETEFARALYQNPQRSNISNDRFMDYDSNIIRYSHQLRMSGEYGRSWKPFQYLALLFTEHYLSRYFDDPEKLLNDLERKRTSEAQTRHMPKYVRDDLHTVAFQSATGSGKTLILHANILQYRHWLERKGGRLNNVVLLTPNERMSEQHQKELQASGLNGRLFSADLARDLISTIEILDQNKLAEKKGIKRVAVGDFGNDNLVLVDEGHLGASGQVWRERRKELSAGGFTFEYSATFNQIANRDNTLCNAYGKCLLFNYSYNQFHKDGYGKDYSISNLPAGIEDANSNVYLLARILHELCKIGPFFGLKR